MASEIIHIGREMRNNAYAKKSRGKIRLRVSPDAVKEMISYLKSYLECAMATISEDVVKSNHPQTVYGDDIVKYFSFKASNPFNEEPEETINDESEI